MARGVAIIGCGLIGHKRAKTLTGCALRIVADVQPARAEALAKLYPNCEATTDWRAAVSRADVSIVIVSTVNDALAPVLAAAVSAGKHVLIEKPAARYASELEPILTPAKNVTVKVGFNHRFHPGLRKAKQIIDAGELGPLLYIRARYGHGGRLGYDKEWRADPAIAGGGELLDQGVHLIDLSRWFLGDFSEVQGQIDTYFWKMPVEDNGFLMLRTDAGQTAWLHASCTEWKNLFSFEVFGRDGKLQIDGLGGSYGTERLTHYKMLPQMGPPETSAWEYPGEDRSWHDEFADFLHCIETGNRPLGDLDDAYQALKVVESVYAQSNARAVA